MEQELEQYHKSNNALKLMIGELRLKMEGMRQEYEQQQFRKTELLAYIEKFKKGLSAVYRYTSAKPETHDGKELKHQVKKLFGYYSTHPGPDGSNRPDTKKKKRKGDDKKRESARKRSAGADEDDGGGGNSLQREYRRQRE